MNFNKINSKIFLLGSSKYSSLTLLLLIGLLQFASFTKIFFLEKPCVLKSGISHHKKQQANKNLDIITEGGADQEGIIKTLSGEFTLKGISIRPDLEKPLKAKLLLNKSQEEIEIEDKKPLFVFFDSHGFIGLTNQKISTPIKIIPHINRKEVNFFIEKIPHQTIASFSLSPVGDSEVVKLLQKQFLNLKVHPIDGLIKFYKNIGDKKFTININGQSVYLKEEEIVGFDGENFTDNDFDSKYLIQLKYQGQNQIKVECFDPSGFYSISFFQPCETKYKTNIPKIEEPKQVVLRGLNRIGCVFQGKKQIMQKGDFFILEDNIWKKIFSLEELNALIEYKIQSEIFVIEEIIAQDKTISLIGKVFDKSRLNFNNINWRFENKKKVKELMKTKPNSIQPIDNIENLGPDETEEVF